MIYDTVGFSVPLGTLYFEDDLRSQSLKWKTVHFLLTVQKKPVFLTKHLAWY